MPLRELGLVGFLLLGLAGAVGTWARYLVALGAARAFGAALPAGTLIVNVLGCLAMGFVARGATSFLTPAVRFVLMTGFLGGLTTYSAFNNETTALFETRGAFPALVNVASTVLLCLAAGLAGVALARRFVG